MVKRFLVSVLVALTAAGSAAQAADLAPLFGQPEDGDAEPPADFTFGTGWYLRGDLTATDDQKPNFLGTLSKSSQRDWNYGLGGGVGYKFNQYFRADITGDYFGQQRTNETQDISSATLALKSNLRHFDGLVNAYIDFGNFAGLTPYIGAGVGFAGVRLGGFYDYTSPAGHLSDGTLSAKTRYDLAWAAMAGVSYNLSQNLLLDIGYRYLDLGTYQIPRFAVGPFNVGSKTDLTSHEIRAGVRYMIF